MVTLIVASLAWGAAGIPEPIAAQAKKSGECFVRLSFWFGPDTRSLPGEDDESLDDLAQRYYERKMSFKWTGITVDPDGGVLCADPYMPMWRIARVEAERQDGRKIELAPGAVFLDWNALFFAPKKKPDAPVPYVEFGEARFALGDPFYRVEVMLVSRDRYLQIAPAVVELVPLGAEPEYRAFFGLKTDDVAFGGALLLDQTGKAVGFQTEYDLWDGPGGLTTYNPAQLRTGVRLDGGKWRDLCGRVETRVAASARKVQIYLRNVKDEEEEEGGFYDADETQKVLVCYGIAVGGGRFLLPVEMAREQVHQITKITVGDGAAEKEVPFIGMFAQWGALLAGGAEGVEPLALRGDAAPRRGKLFLVHKAEERFGRLYQETDYNRYFNVKIGMGEEEMPALVKGVKAPAMLFDTEGEMVGLYLVRKSADTPTAAKRWEQVVSATRFAAILAEPEKALDPLAKPRPAREEKRPVWLGVEFQPVNRELCETLQVLGPTREGRVGLIVSHIYAKSPAEKLGLAVGDILLKLQQEGQEQPVEFVTARRGSYGGYFWGRSFGGEDDDGEPEPYRIWRPARNYLTAILTKIGPGKKVALTWLSAGQEKRAELTLEEGKDDFESAEKLVERTIGLTVRNLTYEVRDALRLGQEDPGVVISTVEPGGKAAVRFVRPFEILTHIGATALRDVGDVRKALEEAKSGGEDQLVLRLWNFGETRIVTIDPAAPPARPGPHVR